MTSSSMAISEDNEFVTIATLRKPSYNEAILQHLVAFELHLLRGDCSHISILKSMTSQSRSPASFNA